MHTLLTLLLGLSLISPAAAQDAGMIESTDSFDPVEAWQADPTQFFDAAEVDLEAFRWIARPLVVFSDSPNNPNFREQLNLLREDPQSLADRDVVVITDTDPAGESDARQALRPRGFMFAMVGKDGGVKLRKPFPWNVREITRSIDKSPLRRQELRDANKPGG